MGRSSWRNPSRIPEGVIEEDVFEGFPERFSECRISWEQEELLKKSQKEKLQEEFLGESMNAFLKTFQRELLKELQQLLKEDFLDES